MPGCDLQYRCPDLQGVQCQWSAVLMRWLAGPDYAATAAACQPHLHATCLVLFKDWTCCDFADRFTQLDKVRCCANNYDQWVSSPVQLSMQLM